MNKQNVILASLLLVGSSLSAHAVDDIATAQASLTTGLTTVGTIAGGVDVLAAGVLVFKKIVKYFNKVG